MKKTPRVLFIAISDYASQEWPEIYGIKIIEKEDEDEARDEFSFDNHLQELTIAILGEDALGNQKYYL